MTLYVVEHTYPAPPAAVTPFQPNSFVFAFGKRDYFDFQDLAPPGRDINKPRS
jgi:hypothetical protein